MATAAKPRMSDEAVESKTGKTWSRWFKHLDTAGAKKDVAPGNRRAPQ